MSIIYLYSSNPSVFAYMIPQSPIETRPCVAAAWVTEPFVQPQTSRNSSEYLRIWCINQCTTTVWLCNALLSTSKIRPTNFNKTMNYWVVKFQSSCHSPPIDYIVPKQSSKCLSSRLVKSKTYKMQCFNPKRVYHPLWALEIPDSSHRRHRLHRTRHAVVTSELTPSRKVASAPRPFENSTAIIHQVDITEGRKPWIINMRWYQNANCHRQFHGHLSVKLTGQILISIPEPRDR
jgi:hypothetical protein